MNSGSGSIALNKAVNGGETVNVGLTGTVLGTSATVALKWSAPIEITATLVGGGTETKTGTSVSFSAPFRSLSIKAVGQEVQIRSVLINTVSP